MRRIAVLDAPSNLGLRPPTATSVPGCAKAPGALRDHGLLAKLGARDAGCVTPPRYDPGDWRPGDGVAHAAQIASYSRRLADRIGVIIDGGEFPVVLGGDCSILLGSGIAMHRLGEAVGGRIGLVFVDGHSDFRHPGNASYVGAAAGEDLALVTGRGQADLAAIESRRPYFRDIDVVVLGIRAQDEYRLDLQAAGIITRPVPALRAEGAARTAQWARDQLVDCAGYWVHVDVDVLDPAVMPAVDAPSPGGIAFPELELLLAGLVETPHCLGVEITVFDPDYDDDGLYAAEISSTVAAGLSAAKIADVRPDLRAARKDLLGPGRRLRIAPEPPVSASDTSPDPVDLTPVSLAAETEAPDPAEGEPDLTGEVADPVGELPDLTGELSRSAGELSRSVGELPELSGGLPELTGELPELADEMLDSVVESAGRIDGGGHAAVESDSSEISEISDSSDGLPGSATPFGGSAIPFGGEPRGALDKLAVRNAFAARDAFLARAALRNADEPDEPESDAEDLAEDDADQGIGLVPRPLGQAPLLDSEPLPATRPGMLRPRTADEDDSFVLPAQRPRQAFDLGSGEPADIT